MKEIPVPLLTPAGSGGAGEAPLQPVAERGTGNPDYAARALKMDRNDLSRAFHDLKDDAGLAPNDNVRIMIPSGDVYFGPQLIGNLRDWSS